MKFTAQETTESTSKSSTNLSKDGEPSSQIKDEPKRSKESTGESEIRRRFKNESLKSDNFIDDKYPSKQTDDLLCRTATAIFPALTSFAVCLVGGAAIYEIPELIYSRLIPQSVEHPDTVWKTAEVHIATAFSVIILTFALAPPIVASLTRR